MALQRSSALERFEEQQRLAAQEWEQKEMGLMEKRRLALVLRTRTLTRTRTRICALNLTLKPHLIQTPELTVLTLTPTLTLTLTGGSARCAGGGRSTAQSKSTNVRVHSLDTHSLTHSLTHLCLTHSLICILTHVTPKSTSTPTRT